MSQTLEYARPGTSRRHMGRVGYYILVPINCASLLAGLLMVYWAGPAHDGYAQLAALMIGAPIAMVQLAITGASVAVAGRLRHPLTIFAAISLLINGGAMALLFFGHHYGAC
jgi:hypothetical protein